MSQPPSLPLSVLGFLADLRLNNSRDWFEEHRHFYDNLILPSLTRILAYLWEEVRDLYPDYVALPKINKSFYRIYRDVRFSKDKSPLKTHLGMLIYRRTRNQSPFLYLHFEPEEIFWACGQYMPDAVMVSRYRDWVAREENNRRLGSEVARLRERYSVNEPELKRLPRDYADLDLPHPELLRYKGVYAMVERAPGPWLENEPWLDEAVAFFRDCRPFMELVEAWCAEPSPRPPE